MAGIRLNTQAIAGSATSTVIGAGAISDSHVATDAAISYSKLSLAGKITGNDVATDAAIPYSKLSLADALLNSDVAANAAIDYSKLNLSGKIQSSDLASEVGGKDVFYQTASGDIDGTNKVFTVATAPAGNNLMPFVNGVMAIRMTAATDATEQQQFYMANASATVFTMGAPPLSGDFVAALTIAA